LEKPYRNFVDAISHVQPRKIPVCIWNTRGNIGLKKEQKIIDYYQDLQVKAYAQLAPLDMFENIIVLPGFWPDYGIALESSAFNCEIRFDKHNPPQPLPKFKGLQEVNNLKKIDPNNDGLMPVALKEYESMLKILDNKYLERLPYLDGCVLITGPLEVSAMLVGHQRFFMGFYYSPQLIHLLLEIVSEGIIDWLKELEKISGEIKILTMIEHIPGMISSAHFKEYALLYINKIYNSFPKAIKVYHNEDRLNHIIDLLPQVKMDIFHFGDTDINLAKETKVVV